jgi:DNA polymerase III subunit epsilon
VESRLGERATEVEPVAPVTRSESLAGKSVCFTGGSVVTIGGAKLTRENHEQLAAEAGLIVHSGVSHGLDLLVMADPDSQSGKAQKADQYGTRRIAEPAFWRAIGVQID